MIKSSINTDDGESISRYFKEVKKTSLLTPEEELNLAKKIKEGDTRAIDKLVKANLKFVVSIAREYQGQGLPLSDLISEGNYGLVKAATRFDHNKGFRFISYAVWWIKQSIMQSLNDNARTIRLPSSAINKINLKNSEINRSISCDIGLSSESCQNNQTLLSTNLCSKSLNDKFSEDGDDELVDYINIEFENNIDDEIVNQRVKNELVSILSVLDERERSIIECYFGMNDEYESMTLEAIGEKYGLTKERIRQIKEQAIRKLRHNSSNLFNILNE